jgi:hypothetical protein
MLKEAKARAEAAKAQRAKEEALRKQQAKAARKMGGFSMNN